MLKKTLTTLVALMAMLGLTAVLAPAASASTGFNGVCEVNEICLYWGDNNSGAVFDTAAIYSDFGTQRFVNGSGTGQGSYVKNNAASIWNRTVVDICVFYNENFGGPSDLIPRGVATNLVVTKNDNASDRKAYDSGERCAP
jgi:hypothetical protein